MPRNAVTLNLTLQVIRYGTSDFLNDGSFDGAKEQYHAGVGVRPDGVPLKYTKIVSGFMVEMSQGEKDTVDANTTPPRATLLSGNNVIHVYELSDFPAASGGTITLASNTDYVIHNSITFSDTITIPAASKNTICISSGLIHTLYYTGSGVFINSVGYAQLLLKLANIVSTSSATLFNLVGDANSVLVSIDRNLFAGFASLGLINNLTTLAISQTRFINNGTGLNINNIYIFSITRCSWSSSVDVGGTAITLCGSKQQGSIRNSAFILQSGESAVDIRPHGDIVGEVRLVENSIVGPGSFFKPGSTAAITNYATSVRNGSIINFSDNGSGGTTVTASSHGLYNYQIVTISGTTNYNASNLYISAVTASTFDIQIAFVANDATGSFTADSTTITSAAHGLSEGDELSIKDTINYNDGYQIYNVVTNTFEVAKAYTINESVGIWDTGSMNEKDVLVDSLLNSGQKSSNSIGTAYINNNSTETTITTQDQWEGMTMNSGIIAASNMERFTLTNSTTGELRYDGISPFSGTCISTLFATSNSGVSQFSYRICKNGGLLPDPIESIIDINTRGASCTLIVPLSLNKGDLVNPQITNIEDTSNITIKNWSIEIS